jgi:hypothetical protein
MMSTKKTIEGLFVPGLWECAECDFTLLQQVMSAADGSVAPDDRPGGACPNCECLLHRVSWRTSAETLETRLITAIDEIRELEAKVQELTRLRQPSAASGTSPTSSRRRAISGASTSWRRLA